LTFFSVQICITSPFVRSDLVVLAYPPNERNETAMSANQAQGIIEYMPTLAERKSLRDYMKAGPSQNGESAAKSFERLCECEKFMVAMMTVKQSKRKIRALLFKLQFRGCIHDLAHGDLVEDGHVCFVSGSKCVAHDHFLLVYL